MHTRTHMPARVHTHTHTETHTHHTHTHAPHTHTQDALRKEVRGIGGLEHADYRAFRNERRVSESRGFIDGDLIETFLDFSPAVVQKVGLDLSPAVVRTWCVCAHVCVWVWVCACACHCVCLYQPRCCKDTKSYTFKVLALYSVFHYCSQFACLHCGVDFETDLSCNFMGLLEH